jgi:hypothetical protein
MRDPDETRRYEIILRGHLTAMSEAALQLFKALVEMAYDRWSEDAVAAREHYFRVLGEQTAIEQLGMVGKLYPPPHGPASTSSRP